MPYKNIIFIFAIIGAALVAATSANGPGSPAYTEIIPTRALYKNTPEDMFPPTWPIFPSARPADQAVVVQDTIPIILAEGILYRVNKSNSNVFSPVTLDHVLEPQSKIFVTNGTISGYISPSKLCTLSCNFGTKVSTCKTISCSKMLSELGAINCVTSSIDTQTMDNNRKNGNALIKVWAAGERGLGYATIEYSTGSIINFNVLSTLSTLPLISVVVSGDMTIPNVKPLVVVGNSEKIWFLDYDNPAIIVRYEWVTDIPTGAGGVVSSTITSMVYDTVAVPEKLDSSDGRSDNDIVLQTDLNDVLPNILFSNLYIGTQNNLNIRFGTNSSYTTINGDLGLPTSNITCLAFSKTKEAVGGPDIKQLWIGTTDGLSVWQKGHDPEFRYLYKERWLAGSTIKSLAIVPRNDDDENILSGDTIVVVAEEGVTILEQQLYTLDRKAELFQSIQLKNHNRNGLTAECNLPGFGDNRKTLCEDSDNNGLWTSLVVVSAYMKYSITNDPKDLKFASTFFDGLTRFHYVTNIDGLMARSLCSPDENPFKDCGVGGKPGQWRNSSNPNFQGWSWKSDTSSDEVTGHAFALSIVAKLSPIQAERDEAATLLNNFVLRIINNGYKLIDWTGKPTSWGWWNPNRLNNDRSWSDGRGVNSMQMLAFLSAAYSVSNETTKPILINAYKELCNSTNQYNENILNLKITAPSDDNYSDDELTFLPYFTFLYFCQNETVCPFERAPVLASLERTFEIVRPERPDLWDAIYLSMTGKKDASIVNDMLWNLRTWPLELITWHTSNIKRKDLIYDRDVTRFGIKNVQTLHTKPPVPNNERGQGLWNGNPWDVAPTGNGMSEYDAGAWLLPYWMARYFSLF
eukprot:g4601.t1